MRTALIVIALVVPSAKAASVDEVIADMEKRVAAEPRQDEKGLHALYRDLNEHQGYIALNKRRSRKKVLKMIANKSQDWRLRTILASSLQFDDSKAVAAALLPIVKDEHERPEVRGGAARGLSEVAIRDGQVCRDLNQLAVKRGLPEAVASGIMFSVQDCGCDDLDAMLKLMHSTPTSLNGLGVNFGAVRCLRTSKHPKALGYLADVIINEPGGSNLRGVALDQMLLIAKNEPGRFRAVSGKMVEPLIAMTYSEELGGGNLNTALQLIGQTKDARAVDRLIELLDHPEALICARSVEALDLIGDPKALPALLKVWKNIPDDPRSNFRWRYWYRRWKKHPRDPVVSALVHAIKSMGGTLTPIEHSL